MKKIILSLILLVSFASYANTPDDSIAKNFKESFPEVSEVKWYKYEDHHIALFTKNEVVCRVTYDLQGNMTALRKDYYAKDLCPFITSKLKEKFPGKEVYGVTEVKSNDGLNYEITLQDDKNWYKVKSDAGGALTLDQKLKKA